MKLIIVRGLAAAALESTALTDSSVAQAQFDQRRQPGAPGAFSDPKPVQWNLRMDRRNRSVEQW
jgi:hypothetical protein